MNAWLLCEKNISVSIKVLRNYVFSPVHFSTIFPCSSNLQAGTKGSW